MNAGASLLADLHMHSEHSWDCTTPIDELLDAAVAAGLGALALTDHNTIAGGLEARARAVERGLPLHVVVGSEIKTAADGELIGLFLHEEVPRGLSFAETIERIRAQGGVVSLPHPFDRFHTTPDPALLEQHAGSIDVVETANARLWLERDNRKAERFASEHGLRRGAGSDAHVPAGIGTGALRLAPFDDPTSFLRAVDDAEIVRRPRNMLRLQVEKRRRQRAKPS
ncbi:MAG TPA: PHP domain-containing protein [Gaiellales bacterium]|jgi:predicted metal-dependent phosphoesterase TrpH|nr:PHP domain-containing protein [Gaiellales bacterium]